MLKRTDAQHPLAGNERCTPSEVEPFLRDASADRYDGETLSGLDAEEFFDPKSVRWYRRVFDERNLGRHQGLSDVEFLNEWGFVVEQGDRLAPTRAATLVFGRARHVRRVLPRPVVDCQFIDSPFHSWSTDRRWYDRIVVEENLVQAWLTLPSATRNMPNTRSAWMRQRSGEMTIPPITSRSAKRPSICSSTRTTAITAARRRSGSSAIGPCSGIGRLLRRHR